MGYKFNCYDTIRDKNDKYQYILVAVDILSRYAWTRALKTKTGNSIKDALKSIFREGRKPFSARSDK